MSSHRFRPWISELLFIVTWNAFCMVGCVPSSRQPSNSTDSSSSKNTAASPTVKLEFPEGDSSVPAEMGGPGFTGDGWMTHVSGPIGDPRAELLLRDATEEAREIVSADQSYQITADDLAGEEDLREPLTGVPSAMQINEITIFFAGHLI